jgi:hypothetical protein
MKSCKSNMGSRLWPNDQRHTGHKPSFLPRLLQLHRNRPLSWWFWSVWTSCVRGVGSSRTYLVPPHRNGIPYQFW